MLTHTASLAEIGLAVLGTLLVFFDFFFGPESRDRLRKSVLNWWAAIGDANFNKIFGVTFGYSVRALLQIQIRPLIYGFIATMLPITILEIILVHKDIVEAREWFEYIDLALTVFLFGGMLGPFVSYKLSFMWLIYAAEGDFPIFRAIILIIFMPLVMMLLSIIPLLPIFLKDPFLIWSLIYQTSHLDFDQFNLRWLVLSIGTTVPV